MTPADDHDEYRCGVGLNPDPDFGKATDDPRVEAHLELIWTVLSRGVDNRHRWDHIDESAAVTMFFNRAIADALEASELVEVDGGYVVANG